MTQQLDRIRFRDLGVTDPERRARLLAVADRVLSHGMVIMGPEVEEFERRFAAACARPHCVGVANGTSALYLALRALGIKDGDEVITTPMSWIATLNAINAVGAIPVFVDVADDFNIDVDLIEAAITPKTRAILPVHYYGRMCEMEAICAIADRHGLKVIEDAAQAAGAWFKGKPAGSLGDVAAFSFNAMKVFGAFGEAGAVVTDDVAVRDKLLSLRYLGTVDRETCVDPELNHKIDSLQAAFLSELLPELGDLVDLRNRLGLLYQSELNGVVECPRLDSDRRSTVFDYTILANDRDGLLAHLERHNIEAKVKHRLLMCDQPAYAHLARPHIPRARAMVERILTLPLHEKMTEADVCRVARAVRAYYR